ncbi:MAG: hypothetical protein ACE5DM_02050 [Candidatus Nanoarchaeia archaeon]
MNPTDELVKRMSSCLAMIRQHPQTERHWVEMHNTAIEAFSIMERVAARDGFLPVRLGYLGEEYHIGQGRLFGFSSTRVVEPLNQTYGTRYVAVVRKEQLIRSKREIVCLENYFSQTPK